MCDSFEDGDIRYIECKGDLLSASRDSVLEIFATRASGPISYGGWYSFETPDVSLGFEPVSSCGGYFEEEE
jgi:hypothetical protein